MKKVFLVLGNKELEETIRDIRTIEVFDSEQDLDTMVNLLEFITTDYLIINKLLDDEGNMLLDIAERANKRSIKIIMLVDDFKEFKDKKLISALVSKGVYCYLKISELSQDQITKCIDNYPEKFDFGVLAEKSENKIKKEIEVKQIQRNIESKKEVEVLNGLTLSLISNAPTGKSSIAWVLTHLFSERGYNTSLVNIDEHYSANILFGALDDEKAFNAEGTSIYENSNILKNNLNLFTSDFMGGELNNELFIKYLNTIRLNSDVTIIDCRTGLNPNMKSAMINSDIVLFIFDINNMHTRLNLELVKILNEDINPKKTIVVINNAYKNCDEYSNTIKFVKSLKKDFKDIIPIKNAGSSLYEAMYTLNNPIKFTRDKEFINDFEILMKSLSARSKNKNFFEKIFKG